MRSTLRCFAPNLVETSMVDRSFECGLGDRIASPKIDRKILTLGAQLGVKFANEGVEIKSRVRHLRKMGCANAQGYFFARPLDWAAISRFSAYPIFVQSPKLG